MTEHRLAIFASGNGSNAENIIRYFSSGDQVKVSLILTNNHHAGVIKRAKTLNVPVYSFGKNEFYNSAEVLKQLSDYKVDFIVLAGFLWLMPENILKLYPNKIINIHPALLPKYGGKGMYGDQVHKAVKEAKETETGITIHFVNENYDEGEIIFNAKCSINPETESINEIASRVHELEYKYYPQIIEKVLNHIN